MAASGPKNESFYLLKERSTKALFESKPSSITAEDYLMALSQVAQYYLREKPSDFIIATQVVDKISEFTSQYKDWVSFAFIQQINKLHTEFEQLAQVKLKILMEGLARYPEILERNKSSFSKLNLFSGPKKTDARTSMEASISNLIKLERELPELTRATDRFVELSAHIKELYNNAPREKSGKDTGKHKALLEILLNANLARLNSGSPYKGESKIEDAKKALGAEIKTYSSHQVKR